MDNYVFVCIGSNKIIYDSLGPRVGEKLEQNFNKHNNIQVFGTMKNPIHFKNALLFLENKQLYKDKTIILVDSCLGQKENIGSIYVSCGGIEIGKAFGRSIYFPAHINIKTIVGNKLYMPEWNINKIDLLATNICNKITQTMKI